MRLSLKDIEEKVQPLGNRLSYGKELIFDLLAAYGRSPANISRLRSGQLNTADDKANEVAQKNIVYFKPVEDGQELYLVVDDLKSSPTVVRYSTRFVIVTDYTHLLAVDTKTNETLDIALRDISKHYTFFLPWAGMEKAQFFAENHADVKAAEKMAKLFDILVAHNQYTTALEWHNLTTFFTRLLFCFFAEDTNIFQKNQFSNAVASYTQEDGSDLRDFLKVLFASLDDEDKDGYPAHLAAFPYVNGELFKDFSQIPKFNKESRKLLLEASSKLDWSQINPDIFGSMFQAVVRPGERTGLGQHYTSVPNIMKTIEPLFLDELREEFNNSYDDLKKLEKLLGRIGKIKVFDPACGSGNFLIIAYKELRRFEHAILERQGEITGQTQQALLGSRVSIENFYGIEIDDFAHEVAILSLWLAKHQMNLEFSEKFGIDLPLIPLKEAGNIVQGNATRIDWNEVCPNNGRDEIYLIGNPPYLGSRNQKPSHKADLKSVTPLYKSLDYISAWFIKGARYILDTNAELTFVSTNSVSQGEQVSILWKPILSPLKLEIGFAHTSFKWSNNARGSAGVTCVIINLRNVNSKQKYIFTETTRINTDHINAYLAPTRDVYISRRSKPLASSMPIITFGSMANDKGNLTLSTAEKERLLTNHPELSPYIKSFIGAAEFLRGQERWCIIIPDKDLPQLRKIPEIESRLNNITKHRAGSSEKSTRQLANSPNRFYFFAHKETDSIIIPRVSSERRDYIPAGYLDKNTIISDAANAIYNAQPYVFGIVSSRLHMAWVRAVAGRLKTDLRYSSALVYNNFPVPILTSVEKQEIEEKALAVLDVRENHSEKHLSDMYDPDKMPDDLRHAHKELDEVVDTAYRKKPFSGDEERFAYLFDLYESMTAKETEKA